MLHRDPLYENQPNFSFRSHHDGIQLVRPLRLDRKSPPLARLLANSTHSPPRCGLARPIVQKKVSTNRPRESFRTAEIPWLSTDGTPRRSQCTNYYFWEVEHYWNHTADRRLAKKIGPVLDQALGWTYDKYDTDRNLLLAWGHEVANQEDYIKHPFDGSTPTIEGIKMMRTPRDSGPSGRRRKDCSEIRRSNSTCAI